MTLSTLYPVASEGHFDTVLALSAHDSSRATAAACREAALSFLNDAPYWGFAELMTWLMGPYAQVSRHVPTSSRRGFAGAPTLRDVDVSTVEVEMYEARAEVLKTLERLDKEGATEFVGKMIAAGFVARCEDAQSVAGWVPTSLARRLVDRLHALIAVDFLTRPRDYETQLSICQDCSTVGFDELARRRGRCHRHNAVMLAVTVIDDLCA